MNSLEQRGHRRDEFGSLALEERDSFEFARVYYIILLSYIRKF